MRQNSPDQRGLNHSGNGGVSRHQGQPPEIINPQGLTDDESEEEDGGVSVQGSEAMRHIRKDQKVFFGAFDEDEQEGFPAKIRQILDNEYKQHKLQGEPNNHFRHLERPDELRREISPKLKTLFHLDYTAEKTFLYMLYLPFITAPMWKTIFDAKARRMFDSPVPKALHLIMALQNSDLYTLTLLTSASQISTIMDVESCEVDVGELIHCSEISNHPCTMLRIEKERRPYTRLRIGRVTVDIAEGGKWDNKTSHIGIDVLRSSQRELDGGARLNCKARGWNDTSTL